MSRLGAGGRATEDVDGLGVRWRQWRHSPATGRPSTVRFTPLGSPSAFRKRSYVHVRWVPRVVVQRPCGGCRRWCGPGWVPGGYTGRGILGGYYPSPPTQYPLVLPGPTSSPEAHRVPIGHSRPLQGPPHTLWLPHPYQGQLGRDSASNILKLVIIQSVV